mgnify:FL=1
MKNFLEHASRKYYEGNPIISDEEFDFLAKEHNFTPVGYSVTDAYPHAYRMYSLQKYTPTDAPSNRTGWIRTVKLDGAAISMTFRNEKLLSVLTRGDGIEGRDVTHLFRGTNNEYNMFSDGFYQITGELVAPKTIKNARNYAAGALGLKDQHEYWNRKLTFFPYDVQSPGLKHCKFWTDRLDWLVRLGFNDIRKDGLEDIYPTDGEVWRINSLRDYDKLGHTSHHPRGSFAVKEAQKPVVTTLRKVEWQLGKSGVVSPVGHFDQIQIGHAIISKATLHNMEYIRNLGLELGCKIGVIRSGEIIPRIVGRYDG